MPRKILAFALLFTLALIALFPTFDARAAAAAQNRENLLFLDKPEMLRLAAKVEKLMNETLEGVSGSETFIYLNAQWMQLVLNAALREALVLEYIHEQRPGAGEKSVMDVMSKDANALYLGYIEYNLRNINAMTAVHAGAGDNRLTTLFAELSAIYVDAASLYRDMEARRAHYLGK